MVRVNVETIKGRVRGSEWVDGLTKGETEEQRRRFLWYREKKKEDVVLKIEIVKQVGETKVQDS